MTITVEQSDAEILDNFHAMEEGQEYVLNSFWISEANRLRKKNNFSPIKKDDYKFVRRGQKLFINGVEQFDFTGESNLAFAFALPFTLAFTFTFALALALAFALQHNGLEKLNAATSCEGKVVEIDGKKYKLTAV
jgi:hypothetical protein